MKKCLFEVLIDDYLLNRLSSEKKDKFEEHYFSCPFCFEKMVERDEFISVVKNKGDMIFQDEYLVEEAKEAAWFKKIVYLLTPKQWAMATISAALLVIIICFGIPYIKTIGVIPGARTIPLPISIDDDTIRGPSIDLISPVIDIETVPSKFEWKKSGEDVEYRIYIYDNGEQLWTTTTKENFIVLPEDVKKRMTLGEKYSWKVKAFSPEGTLIAVSSKTQFKITRTK